MIVDVKALVEDDILSGAIQGRAFLSKIIAKAGKEPVEPEPLILDFSQAEVATVSFLRESVLGLRDMMRSRRSNWYPLVANPNDAVKEELATLLDLKGDVLLVCQTNEAGELQSCEPVGRLERVQQLTFEAVQKQGETGAAELRAAYPDPPVELTAWNNRLSGLAERGLVIEFSRGRLKRYRPVLSER